MSLEKEENCFPNTAQAFLDALRARPVALPEAELERLKECAKRVIWDFQFDMKRHYKEMMDFVEEMQERCANVRDEDQNRIGLTIGTIAKKIAVNTAISMTTGIEPEYLDSSVSVPEQKKTPFDGLRWGHFFIQTYDMLIKSAQNVVDIIQSDKPDDQERTFALLKEMVRMVNENKPPFSRKSEQCTVFVKFFFSTGIIGKTEMQAYWRMLSCFVPDMRTNFLKMLSNGMGWTFDDSRCPRNESEGMWFMQMQGKKELFSCKNCGCTARWPEGVKFPNTMRSRIIKCRFCGSICQDTGDALCCEWAYLTPIEKWWHIHFLAWRTYPYAAILAMIWFFLIPFLLIDRGSGSIHIFLFIYGVIRYIFSLLSCNKNVFVKAFGNSLRRTRSLVYLEINGLKEKKKHSAKMCFPYFFTPANRKRIEEIASRPITVDECYSWYGQEDYYNMYS